MERQPEPGAVTADAATLRPNFGAHLAWARALSGRSPAAGGNGSQWAGKPPPTCGGARTLRPRPCMVRGLAPALLDVPGAASAMTRSKGYTSRRWPWA
jgi:hypothetical protein